MNTADIILTILILMAVTAAVISILRRKKQGKCCGCGGNCAGCQICGGRTERQKRIGK